MGIYNSSSKEANDKYTESQLTTTNTSPDWPLPSSLHRDISSTFNSIFESTPLNNLLGESLDETLTNLNHFRKDNAFNDFFNGTTSSSSIKSAMKAYPVPNTYSYQKCKDSQGLSGWDENGWWRCLFPRSRLTREGETSKEDVENDSENKFGLFFKEYSGLMDWKCQVRQLLKQKREEDKLARQSANIQSIYNDYAKDISSDHQSSNNEADQAVISSSKSSYFTTLENGDFEEIIESNKVFSNGDSKHEKVKKIYPKGGGDVIVEQLAGDGHKDNTKTGKLNSWIWGEEKK